MTENNDDIVVFRQFDNAIDANIAKTKLDAYGIACFLTEENMANLYPGQSLLAFNVRLHLFAMDQEQASQVLVEDGLSVDSENQAKCPKCNSRRIIREFPKKLADKLTFILFGVLFPHKKVNRCLDCGCEF